MTASDQYDFRLGRRPFWSRSAWLLDKLQFGTDFMKTLQIVLVNFKMATQFSLVVDRWYKARGC